MTRAWSGLLVIAPLLLATCDKGSGSATPPELAASDPAGDAGLGDPAAGDEGLDDPAGDPASDAGGDATAPPTEDPAASEGGDDAAGEPPPTAVDPDPTADPPTTKAPKKAAKLELPKPLNSTVKGSCGKDPGVGTKLRGFKLPSTESGKTVSNGTYRGRVVLVNFWGTWCKPCLKELPKFAQLYRRYRKHGMTLLAIATDEDAAAVKDVLDKKKIAAKVAIGGEEYAGQYGAPEFPFSFIVDHNGVIQASYFGYEPDCMGKLEADLREQLEKRAAAGK